MKIKIHYCFILIFAFLSSCQSDDYYDSVSPTEILETTTDGYQTQRFDSDDDECDSNFPHIVQNLESLLSHPDSWDFACSELHYLCYNPDRVDLIEEIMSEENYNYINYSAYTTQAIELLVRAEALGIPRDFNNSNFLDLIEEETDVDTVVAIYLEILYSVNVAMIRHENPDWPESKVQWHAMKDALHVLLAAGGFVPVLGPVFDLTDGVIYAIEGEWDDAAFSSLSAIPLAGDWVAGAKFFRKTVELTNGSRAYLRIYQAADGTVKFSGRSQLRRVLQIPRLNLDKAHHVIPWRFNEHPVVQAAAKHWNAWHPNDIANAKRVKRFRHTGSHNDYDIWVRRKLDEFAEPYLQNGIDIPGDLAKQELTSLANQLKNIIDANPNTTINQLPL